MTGKQAVASFLRDVAAQHARIRAERHLREGLRLAKAGQKREARAELARAKRLMERGGGA